VSEPRVVSGHPGESGTRPGTCQLGERLRGNCGLTDSLRGTALNREPGRPKRAATTASAQLGRRRPECERSRAQQLRAATGRRPSMPRSRQVSTAASSAIAGSGNNPPGPSPELRKTHCRDTRRTPEILFCAWLPSPADDQRSKQNGGYFAAQSARRGERPSPRFSRLPQPLTGVSVTDREPQARTWLGQAAVDFADQSKGIAIRAMRQVAEL
jgi:hypothetical protein